MNKQAVNLTSYIEIDEKERREGGPREGKRGKTILIAKTGITTIMIAIIKTAVAALVVSGT